MFWKDCIVVKLSEAQLKEALKLEGVQFFAPMEGRLMKEWVQIPYSRNNDWEKFINLSSGYVMQEGKNSNKKPPKQKR